MANIGAYGTAIDTSGKATNLADDLETMFIKFITDAQAVAQGEWTGMAQQAFEEAQVLWRDQARGLSSALAQTSMAVGRNVGDLLDIDHQWSKSFLA